jgi:hypothetical protein
MRVEGNKGKKMRVEGNKGKNGRSREKWPC